MKKHKYIWGGLLGCCLVISFLIFNPFNKETPETVADNYAKPVTALKPGEYKAEYDNHDFRGWKAFFVMHVNSEGLVEKVKFDYVHIDGHFKTEDDEYNKRMTAANGLGPRNYCPRFAKNLEIYQDPEKVDAITGATSSYHSFKEFSQKAFENAKRGDTSTIYVKQPELVDPKMEAQR